MTRRKQVVERVSEPQIREREPQTARKSTFSRASVETRLQTKRAQHARPSSDGPKVKHPPRFRPSAQNLRRIRK